MIEEAKAIGVRKGPWKLILPGRDKSRSAPELYHLVDDPGEEKNIAKKHPEIVQDLRIFYRQEKDRKVSPEAK